MAGLLGSGVMDGAQGKRREQRGFGAWPLWLLLATLPWLPGFVCASRVERLEAESEALKLQFVEIQQRMNTDQTQFTEMLLRADDKLGKIEEFQRKLDDLFKTNTVDFSTELQTMRSEIQSMRGEVQTAQMQTAKHTEALAAIGQMLNISTTGTAVALPATPDEHFKLAEDKLAAAQFADAEVAFREFTVRYPEEPRAETAMLKQGEALFELKQFNDCRIVLQALLKKNARTKHTERAVYLMGMASVELKDCKVAKQFVDYLKDAGSSYHGKLKQSYGSRCN
jgi:TolA-binding protein